MVSMPTIGTINQPSTVNQDQAQQIQQMIAALQNQNSQQAQNPQNAASSINSAPIASPVGAGGVLGTFLLNQLAQKAQQNPGSNGYQIGTSNIPTLFNSDASNSALWLGQ